MVGHLRQMPLAFAASDMAVLPVIEPEAFGAAPSRLKRWAFRLLPPTLAATPKRSSKAKQVSSCQQARPDRSAGAIERMIDAGAERAEMGRKGQERVRALYSKTALQSATLAVYQRVLSEADSRKAAKAPAQPVL